MNMERKGSIGDVLMPGERAGIVLATLSMRQRSEKRPENRSRRGFHIERLDDATVAGDLWLCCGHCTSFTIFYRLGDSLRQT
jgi:hypothetical protein